MPSIFEKASRLKLRFKTTQGEASAEDLWDLPLTSATGKANLDDIARALHKQLKNGDDVSFVDPSRTSNTKVQLQFDVVKHIIDVRMAENLAKTERRALEEQKQQVMSYISKKKEEGLMNKTESELMAELDRISRQLEGPSAAA